VRFSNYVPQLSLTGPADHSSIAHLILWAQEVLVLPLKNGEAT